jgi:hypothetical protein
MSNLSSLMFVCSICLFGLSAQHASAAPCPELSFGPPTYFPSGLNTNGLATGDLNGDGNVDLVAANEGSGTVTVRFGDGAGAFPSSLQLAVTTPSSVAIADLNGDGHLDLVTTIRSNNRVAVRLGIGGGAFGPPVQTIVGSGPSGLAMGDFNGDGSIDLVTSNGGTNSISFLPGNGSGSFPTATNFSISRGSGAFGIIAADFNGDGKQDVATANRSTFNISVLFGNGAGSFAPAVIYATGTLPNSIAAGDFNGDGKPDLVTANFGSNSLTVRINDGLGAFPTSVTLSLGVQPLYAATGDLDDDGNTDIVATNQGSNRLSVFRGNGNGTFAARTDFAVNAGTRALIVGDLNDDGVIDIAAGVNSSAIAVLLNACSANSPPTISAGIVMRQQDAGSSNSIIATVSDEQDDLDDLAVTVNGGASATANGVTVSNISVDALGNVTADVSASCGASDVMFALAVTDSGGLSATAMLGVDVTNETTPPVINKGEPLPDVTVHLPLNSPDLSMPVTFDLPMATDNCTASPTVTTSPVSGSTFNAGATMVTVTATDELDNTSTATFRVNVLYNFGGFLRPIDPFPMLNISTAGSSVPAKFSLSGYKGLNILASGYPASSPIACNDSVPGSTVEETTAGGNGLAYDALSDQYIYVWKTNKAWKGTCRIFILKLTDGSEHYARFQFR